MFLNLKFKHNQKSQIHKYFCISSIKCCFLIKLIKKHDTLNRGSVCLLSAREKSVWAIMFSQRKSILFLWIYNYILIVFFGHMGIYHHNGLLLYVAELLLIEIPSFRNRKTGWSSHLCHIKIEKQRHQPYDPVYMVAVWVITVVADGLSG